MLIIYEQNEKPSCIFIPDDRPWKLEVVAVEDSVEYVIKFVSDVEEVVLSSLDYYDLVEFPDNCDATEDEAVQALVCQIFATAAEELANMARNREALCVDLTKIAREEAEVFIEFWQLVNREKEEIV